MNSYLIYPYLDYETDDYSSSEFYSDYGDDFEEDSDDSYTNEDNEYEKYGGNENEDKESKEHEGNEEADFAKGKKTSLGPFVADVMQRFQSFLDGPDKGTKKRSSYQMYHDVKRIIIYTDCTDDLSNLLANDAYTVKSKYIMGYCEHKHKPIQPSSVKKYLCSLLEFMDFLLLERIKISGLRPEMLRRTKKRIQLWRSKEGRKERFQKHVRANKDCRTVTL